MSKALKTVLAITAMLVAGCNEATVAPHTEASASANANGGGTTANLTMTDTLRFSFVIDPSRNTWYYLGAGNSINFPAGSLCDLSSSYGPAAWDQPCQVATHAVTVQAKAWLDSRGHARLDFQPALRFVPTANPAGWVVLSLTDWSASWYLGSSIIYCKTEKGGCTDEAKHDPTLATIKDPVTGRMTRRIKHFSGYSIINGEPCTVSPDDPDCIDDGTGGDQNKIGVSLSLKGVKRNRDAQHEEAQATIGISGGTLTLPGAGLTIVVPPGAVSQPTQFSISARNGKLVSYDFQPHGTRFAVPLRVTQSLSGLNGLTNAVLGSLQLAYFADGGQVDEAAGTVLPTETLNASVNLLAGTATFNLRHFSGYIFVSGDQE